MPTIVLQGHQEKTGLTELLRLFYGNAIETEKGIQGGHDASPELISRLTAVSDRCTRIETTDGEISFSRLVDEGLTGTRPHPLVRREIKRQCYQWLAQKTGLHFPYGSLTGVRPTRLAAEALARGLTPDDVAKHLTGDYSVSPVKSSLLVQTAEREQAVLSQIAPDDFLVYLNIPICPSRCSYCSFTCATSGGKGVDLERYVDAMVREASAISPHLRQPVDSVYVGGGTPTVLSAAQLERLLSRVLSGLPLQEQSEITVEAGRPDTIDSKKLRVIRDTGAKRISINPQTLHDRTLARIGRHHTVDETLKAYREARVAGFEWINCDLIAGLPGETPDDFLHSVRTLIDWGPENITIHTLAFKRKSELTRSVGAQTPETDDPKWSVALDDAHRRLGEAGFKPYYLYRQKDMVGGLENTGYARAGAACRYNVGMMSDQRRVLGIGAGAMSKYFDEAGWLRRLASPKDLKTYQTMLDQAIGEKIKTFFS